MTRHDILSFAFPIPFKKFQNYSRNKIRRNFIMITAAIMWSYHHAALSNENNET